MFQWPQDKLGLCNSALTSTGDNIIASADDGSDEWNCCSSAYETGLGYIMESHGWGYAAVVKTLTASPTAPPNTLWDTAYPIPDDLVHLLWVKINNDTSDPITQTNAQATLYDIEAIGGVPCIVTNAMGGPPPPPVGTVTPAVVTAKWISNAGALCDSTAGTPTMILALQSFIMAGIFSGLHEDYTQSKGAWDFGEQMLSRAKTRYDQQKPKRQFFNSRIEASRRIRRPWPQIGLGGWNGGGGIG